MADEQASDLQLDEALPHHRRSWVVQHAALAAMTLVLLAALLGLLGLGGPLSRGVAEAGGLSVRYDRFARRLAPAALDLRCEARVVHGGVLSVWVSNDYLEALPPELVTPQPRAVVIGNDRTTFVFDASPDEPGPLAVMFELKPRRALRRRGRVGLTGGPELSFATFVYP